MIRSVLSRVHGWSHESQHILFNIVAVLLAGAIGFGLGYSDGVLRLSSAEPEPASRMSIPPRDSVPEASSKDSANDPLALIELPDERSLVNKRAALIDYIWRGQGFPSDRLPDLVEPIQDHDFDDLQDLAGITRLTVRMRYGVESVAYLLDPVKDNGRLMIYSQGHGESFTDSDPKAVIDQLLARGYLILAIDQPLQGINNLPAVTVPHFGSFVLRFHNQFEILEDEGFSPISYFMEPIAAGLNYVEGRVSLKSVRMMGLSGGGWATTLYAAIDPRVDHSYPVAGSLPTHDKVRANDVGDYEQIAPGLYNIANYLELYVLGSAGEGRRQLQVLNMHDSCCFAGQQYSGYAPGVQKVVGKLGPGSFDLFIDENEKEHTISEAALAKILSDD